MTEKLLTGTLSLNTNKQTKTSGEKHPGPKSQRAKCPGPKNQGAKRPGPKRPGAKRP